MIKNSDDETILLIEIKKPEARTKHAENLEKHLDQNFKQLRHFCIKN